VIAGRYQVDGELGRGGMAEVRAGTDLRLQRPVAVKFLLPEMAARDDIRRRFEAEARAAASLSHPHAVAVFDTGEHEGRAYIVMERLPGETLADRIAAGPVDPEWLRRIVGQVLGALGAAHAAGLVHRDVKPGNILLTADGQAKIADFGIAKSLQGPAGLDGGVRPPDLTGTGQLLGTPAYLAPEQLDGAPASARSDIYGVGVVLYEALAGVRPFPGDTPLAVARAVASGSYRPLAEARPGLDRGLVAVVERAMATDPAHRFPSAAVMADALAGPSGAASSGAAATPTVVDAAGGAGFTAVLSPADLGATQVEGPPPARRPRGRVPLALIVVVVFVALLVAGLNNRSRPVARPSAGGGPPSSETTTTTAPPVTPLAAELRAAASRLTSADGPRAADLAARLRQVADELSGGGGGVAATEAIVAVGTWRLAGQLSDAATVSALALLSQVPGVTVVSTVAPRAPIVPGDSGKGGKGKDRSGD